MLIIIVQSIVKTVHNIVKAVQSIVAAVQSNANVGAKLYNIFLTPKFFLINFAFRTNKTQKGYIFVSYDTKKTPPQEPKLKRGNGDIISLY